MEKLCRRKKWGRNDIREFWTQIFLDGLEHPNFINKENRRKTTKLQIENALLKQQLSEQKQQQQNDANLPNVTDTLARHVETFQDIASKRVADTPPHETAPSEVLPNERKSIVH